MVSATSPGPEKDGETHRQLLPQGHWPDSHVVAVAQCHPRGQLWSFRVPPKWLIMILSTRTMMIMMMESCHRLSPDATWLLGRRKRTKPGGTWKARPRPYCPRPCDRKHCLCWGDGKWQICQLEARHPGVGHQQWGARRHLASRAMCQLHAEPLQRGLPGLPPGFGKFATTLRNANASQNWWGTDVAGP